MSPLVLERIVCQLLNGTMIYLSNTNHLLQSRQNTTISATVDTQNTLSPQTIAIMVLSILFTLSELLASIPEVGANGLVQGILYYLRGGKQPPTAQEIHSKVENLKQELTNLINATKPGTGSSTSTTVPEVAPTQTQDVSKLASQIAELNEKIQQVMNSHVSSSSPQVNESVSMDSMPPGMSQSHYVPPTN